MKKTQTRGKTQSLGKMAPCMKKEKHGKSMMKKMIELICACSVRAMVSICFFILIPSSSGKIELRRNASGCFQRELIRQIEESYEREFGHRPKSILLVKSDFPIDECQGLIYFSANLKSSSIHHKLSYFDSKLFMNYRNKDWKTETLEGLDRFLLKVQGKYYDAKLLKIREDFLRGSELRGIGR